MKVKYHFHDQQYNLNRWFQSTTGGRIQFNNDLANDGQPDIAQVTLSSYPPSCTEMIILARDAVLAQGEAIRRRKRARVVSRFF